MKITRFNHRILSYLLVFGLLSMIACKKDKDVAPNDGVEGSWQISSLTFKPALNGITDYVAALTATGNTCSSRINFVFNGDGTLKVDSPSDCTDTRDLFMTSLGISSSTTWKVEDNNLILTTGSDVSSISLDVNSSTMTLSDTGAIPPDTQVYTVTFVFKRV